MRRLWPDRLAWRIILPVIAVVIGAQFALSWVFIASIEHESWAKDQARYVAQQQARVRHLIETLRDAPKQQTTAILSIANTQDFYAWVAPDTESLARQEGFASSQVSKSLSTALTDVRGADNLVVSSFVPVGLGDFETILAVPDQVVFGYGVDEENLLVEIQISPGIWLRILAPASEFDVAISPWDERPDLLWVAVISVGLVPLLILIIRQVVGPIHTLALSADRIGQGGWRMDDIPETGPLETRQAARALNLMARRIRDFIEDRTRMLAAISHDIASPLTGMRLQAEMVEDPDVRARLIRGIEEISMMSRATLSFARLDASDEPLHAVCFAEFVAELLDDYDRQKVDFVVDPSAKMIMTDIKKTQMRRALRNIIDNALKYGKTATVSLNIRDGALLLDITDTGPGLPEALLEQVFKPFFRAEASRNPETGGTGLGLSIARNLLRAHGGDVKLLNHAEEGLICRVTLPLVNSPASSKVMS